MKRRLWSNPDVEWEGFTPVIRWLDSKRVLNLPLTLKIGNDKTDIPCTVGSVCESLKDKQITKESWEGGHSVNTELEATDGTKLVIDGPDFNRRILEEMLKLRAEDIQPFGTVWFYYDTDSCRQDPDESYSFFVVSNDKIVREQVNLFDYHDSGFDPSVFERDDHSNVFWLDEEAWDEARAKYWYRKFYSETRTGQLMVLRSDNPKLYYYDDPHGPDIMGALRIIVTSLNKIYVLLWVLLTLALLSLIFRWR